MPVKSRKPAQPRRPSRARRGAPASASRRSAKPTAPSLVQVLLPSKVDNRLRGSSVPFYVFALIAVVSTVRSLIHLLAPDGGAGSIAGLDLSVTGADGIIFAFGLWGSAQLINAIVQLLVVFRYRSLVPLMYALLVVETLLRVLVGRIKPVTFAHTPPGAVGNYVILPLAIVMLVLSLWTGTRGSVRRR